MADKFTQNCYAYFNGGVETLVRQNGFFPCGTVNSTSDFLTCCYQFDTCVGNNICKASTADLSVEAEYYLGYCNDPTYTSSACNKECLNLESNGGGSLGIVYNETLAEWTCCNDTKCASLSNNVFKAPAPSSLSVIATPTSRPYSSFTSSSTTSSSTTSSSVPTTSGANTATSPSLSSSSSSSTSLATIATMASSGSHSNLGTGAIVGICVAVAVVVIAILAALTWFILRQRKKRKAAKQVIVEPHTKPELSAEEASPGIPSAVAVPEAQSHPIMEIGDRRNQAWEMSGRREVAELG
ncbi:hypothetical protein ACMFMG_000189 [Clarireedia jacksonii]